MDPGGYTLRSPRGRNRTPDEAALDQAIEEAEATHPEGFVVLERADGTFVQFDGRSLEWGAEGRLFRLDTLTQARDVCRRFLAGETPGEGEPWRDVTWELETAARRRKGTVRNLVVLGLVVLGVLVLGWYLIGRASGT